MNRKTLLFIIFAFLTPTISNAISIPGTDRDTDTWLRFTSASKSYDATTDIFSVSFTGGADLFNFAGTGSRDGVGFNASLSATVDEFGTLHGGRFNITGDMPSMGIPSGTTLLSGSVVAIETVGLLPPGGDAADIDFVVEFLLRIDASLPELGFDTGYAVWTNIFSASTGPVGTPTSVDSLYTVDWGPLGAATFDDIVEVSIPEPGSFALLGLGLVGLGFARRKKLH